MRGVAGRKMCWAAGSVALLALALGSVALAAAPTATTGPATVVASTSATVGGSVDPRGQATTWWVEYGTSTSYGSKTVAANAGAGATAVSVSVNITGLKAGTTYHYRVVANNAAGTSRGGDAVFTTLVPPDVTTGAASSISASGARLNGTVDPNGRSATYYFDYGKSTSYGSKSGSKSAGSATSAQAASAGSPASPPDARTTSALSQRATPARPSARTPRSRRVRADRCDGRRVVDRADDGHAERHGDSQRALDHLVVRVRPLGDLRLEDLLARRRLRHGGTRCVVGRQVAEGRDDVPLPPRCSELEGQGGRCRPHILDRRRAALQTGPPQSVGPDTAVVTGALATRGRATTWWFEYGTSTRYGKSTTRGTQARPLLPSR